MKRSLFCAGLLLAGLAYGQVFQEDWDGNGPGIEAWTVVDESGNTPDEGVSFMTDAWTVVDRHGAQNFGGPAGDHAAASTSWFSPPGQADAWLISPEIELPIEEAFLIWDVKAQDAQYPDGYELRLSPTGGSAVEDFTVVLFSIASEQATWQTRSISLGEYSGTTVRVAWRNNSTDQYILLVDNILVQALDMEAPSCVTLLEPTDGSTVDPANAVFSWEPAEGDSIDNYTFYLGTSIDDMASLGTTTNTSTPLSGLQFSTTYYWTVIPSNLAGAPTDCAIYSFTTEESPLAPYCGPLNFTLVEPITLVEFAGINNSTSAEVGGVPAHGIYLDMVANVAQGETYTIILSGNTAGNYINRFAVFIDWNQNGVLDDAGEVYEVTQLLENSTGTDGVTISHEITVPADAVIGTTRMRVKKIYGTTDFLDPCAGTTFGHAQDYSVEVGTMSTVDTEMRRNNVYPNPTRDVLNISATDVAQVRVYNMLGQQMRVDFNAQTVNVSHLPAGNYILQMENENGDLQNVKFIKK
ncbi:MAG: choice-of-anchor J domain-containing protein [Weeksellaceae bacterium]|nr:choice-of-anchor J domain-containing protein [Weeksellaceae bacterium]